MKMWALALALAFIGDLQTGAVPPADCRAKIVAALIRLLDLIHIWSWGIITSLSQFFFSQFVRASSVIAFVPENNYFFLTGLYYHCSMADPSRPNPLGQTNRPAPFSNPPAFSHPPHSATPPSLGATVGSSSSSKYVDEYFSIFESSETSFRPVAISAAPSSPAPLGAVGPPTTEAKKVFFFLQD